MSLVGTPSTYITTSSSATATGWVAGSGSNRVVVLGISHEENNAAEILSAVSFGGVAASRANYYVANLAFAEVWVIGESSIGSIASDPVISITPHVNGGSIQLVTVFVFDGRDQTLGNWTSGTDTDSYANTLSFSVTSETTYDLVGVITGNAGGSGFTFTGITEVTGSDQNYDGTLSRGATAYGTGSAGSTAITADNSGTSGSTYMSMLVMGIPPTPASSGPTITSTSDDTPTNGTNLTITGTGFGASQGVGGVTLGGTSVTPSSWSDTSIVIPISLGNRLYGSTYNIVVTNNSAQSSSGHGVQIQPAAGYAYVNLSGTLATSGNRLTAIPDLAVPDQVEYYDVQGGSITDVTVYADASIAWLSGVTGFYARANDGTGWGDPAFQDTSVTSGGDPSSTRLVRPISRNIYRTIYSNIGM